MALTNYSVAAGQPAEASEPGNDDNSNRDEIGTERSFVETVGSFSKRDAVRAEKNSNKPDIYHQKSLDFDVA